MRCTRPVRTAPIGRPFEAIAGPPRPPINFRQ